MTCVDAHGVPIIYAPRLPVQRLGAAGRLLALGVAAGCLTVLVVAAFWCVPSTAGVGTHQSLRLPECAWLVNSGVPCPSCGMTTSFAWFARGRWLGSFYVQPMGFVLALLAAMTVWVGLYMAVTGRPITRLLSRVPGRYYLWPLLGLFVAAWAWKIGIHAGGIDGWR